MITQARVQQSESDHSGIWLSSTLEKDSSVSLQPSTSADRLLKRLKQRRFRPRRLTAQLARQISNRRRFFQDL
jgi:hypothetical protein